MRTACAPACPHVPFTVQCTQETGKPVECQAQAGIGYSTPTHRDGDGQVYKVQWSEDKIKADPFF